MKEIQILIRADGDDFGYNLIKKGEVTRSELLGYLEQIKDGILKQQDTTFIVKK